jgi:drug/metabolite transporter (DMT)-like permease
VTLGFWLAVAAMLCYATSIFLTRAGIKRLSADLGFYVLLAGNIVFAAVIWSIDVASRERAFAIDWTAVGWFALSGIVGVYLARRMLLDAVRLLGPARASTLHTASPVSTLLAAWALLGERLGGYELALMVLVVIGLWLTQPRASGGLPSGFAQRALAISAITVIGFGVANAFRGIAIRRWDEAAAGAVIGSLAALGCLLAARRDYAATWRALAAADRRALMLYAGCGIATVGGTMFSSSAMKYMEVSMAMLIVYTTPLVVFPISAFVLRSPDARQPRAILGAALVLTGVALVALRDR